MITCRQLIEFLDSYVEHQLPETEAASFERHLGACPSCVAYVDGYRRSIALGRESVLADAQSSEMPEDLVRAILAARPTK